MGWLAAGMAKADGQRSERKRAKQEIQRWRAAFEASNGRKPTNTEMKQHLPDVVALYKQLSSSSKTKSVAPPADRRPPGASAGPQAEGAPAPPEAEPEEEIESPPTAAEAAAPARPTEAAVEAAPPPQPGDAALAETAPVQAAPPPQPEDVAQAETAPVEAELSVVPPVQSASGGWEKTGEAQETVDEAAPVLASPDQKLLPELCESDDERPPVHPDAADNITYRKRRGGRKNGSLCLSHRGESDDESPPFHPDGGSENGSLCSSHRGESDDERPLFRPDDDSENGSLCTPRLGLQHELREVNERTKAIQEEQQKQTALLETIHWRPAPAATKETAGGAGRKYGEECLVVSSDSSTSTDDGGDRRAARGRSVAELEEALATKETELSEREAELSSLRASLPLSMCAIAFLVAACAAPVLLFLELFTLLGTGALGTTGPRTFKWAANEETLAYPLVAVTALLPTCIYVFDGCVSARSLSAMR